MLTSVGCTDKIQERKKTTVELQVRNDPVSQIKLKIPGNDSTIMYYDSVGMKYNK